MVVATFVRAAFCPLENVVPDEDVGFEGPGGDVFDGVTLEGDEFFAQAFGAEGCGHVFVCV